jgi:hypothetical protein
MLTPKNHKEKKPVELTELDVATAYAQAWNQLNPAKFITMLSPDVRYSSQWVLEDLVSKEAVAYYLTQKMQTVRKAAATVYAEVSQTRTGKVCVLLAQGDKQKINALVVFNVDQGKVTSVDMCIPALYRNVNKSK